MKVVPAAVCFALASSFAWFPDLACAQSDDFDDGNDTGWTRLHPLGSQGVSATFSFPNGNTYRLEADPSPNEELLGQSRLGSLREDVTYTDFYQFIDIVDFDDALDQNIGMLARVSDPGLGTLDGYGVTFNPTDQAIFFTVITNEEGENLADADAFVDFGEPVRLVFEGKGTQFRFQVFLLTDLVTPVASLEVTDSTYASGHSGIFVVTDGADPHLPVDVTYDNYFAAVEKPTGFEICSFEIEDGQLIFEFLSEPGQQYSLWESDDLRIWDENQDSIEADLGEKTTFTMPKPDVMRRFYQFRR